MVMLDAVKMVKLSKAFKLRCEQAAASLQMSWSAWARLAMQRQLDRQRGEGRADKE